MTRRLKFELRLGSLAPAEAWRAILPWFVEVHNKPDVCLNHEKFHIEFDSIAETIERARMKSANVSANDESLASFGDYPTAGIFDLRLFELPENIPPIEPLLERLPIQDFIFGYLFDSEYERWQTVNKPERFERAGLPHEHLPKYWDEELKKERIDISKNPGRSEIRNGKCIEAIGSPMWIGPLFQKRTGGDWRGMKEYDWCEITELDNGVVRLTSWEGPFDSDQGEQRERQEILRKVLFPQTPEE